MPGSVVMDLGSGLGVLGMLAAKAGARKVYFVEPEPVIEVARQAAQSNSFDAELVFLQGKIEDVDLPEKVDAIISVFTGNFLLGEDLLPSLFRARDRHLKPGGVMLPDQAVMKVAPVSLADYYAEQIDVWSIDVEGLDFSAGRRYAANSLYYPKRESFNGSYLAAAKTFTEIDFLTASLAECRAARTFEIDTNGVLHGWAGWFDMRLGDEWFSTAPLAPATHWSPAFLPMDPPIDVNAGEVVQLEIQRPQDGEWTWRSTTQKESRQSSTFLSTPRSRQDMIKNAPDYKPLLSRQGQDCLFVLACFEKNLTVAEIATQLHQYAAGRYPDERSSLAMVRKLAVNFS